jgi:putative FmdB family regulatory protein
MNYTFETGFSTPCQRWYVLHPRRLLASSIELPIYEFECRSCTHRFEELVKVNGSTASAPCPDCGSSDTARLMSAFAVRSVAAKGEGVAAAFSGGGGGCCGGACGGH